MQIETQIPEKETIENPEEKVYEKETYTVSEDGHYVGQDGYIVPKNFPEFFERYPYFVRRFIRSRPWFRNSRFKNRPDYLQDLEHSLLVHLMSLPPTSVFRERGYKDRIETFNPESAYGATEGRFLYHVHRMLQNSLVDISRVFSKTVLEDAMGEGEINIDTLAYTTNEELLAVTSHRGPDISPKARDRQYRECREAADRIDFNSFRSFVAHHNPELVPFMESLLDTHNSTACRSDLGISRHLFVRARRRLRYLYICFEGGTKVQKQRKVYASRKTKDRNVDETSYSMIEA